MAAHAESQEEYSSSTSAIHADDHLNNQLSDVVPPIHVATSFRYSSDPSQLRPFRESDRPNLQFPFQEEGEHCYSRVTTYNTSRLEVILSKLLGAPCLTYSSGLAALQAALAYLIPKNVAIGAGYFGSHGALNLYTRLTGCRQMPLDFQPDDLGQGDLIWLETPVNPAGTAFNIQYFADLAHSRGAYLLVDSTLAPPPLQNAFRQGADIVMHSGTKYIGGHNDMLCGILAVRDKSWIPRMVENRKSLGNVMGSFEGWLAVRSVRTLEVRVLRQSQTATRLVHILNGALFGDTNGEVLSRSDVETIKKVVTSVSHASLQNADDQTWLRNQMPNGYGPVFAIRLTSEEVAKRLPSKLRLFHHATSLGGVESLIEWRAMTDITTDRDVLRVSIGLEDGTDLLRDLMQAFRGSVEE
ncbi:hypothetical protein LTR70_009445 [Exophiala xenobiotica]|uniref:Cystathionine gamma-synthase n=1 Tax=Lithohypha guttulata TaxID=1690604 RepID=A0ABR0JYS4_9EURO|nr:hypothetical protein LTR24_008990 [Lithohypha guttulata]KAK5310475.1 hypothetical protein LTR70_009445 [Exophiala xenobiotica]